MEKNCAVGSLADLLEHTLESGLDVTGISELSKDDGPVGLSSLGFIQKRMLERLGEVIDELWLHGAGLLVVQELSRWQ